MQKNASGEADDLSVGEQNQGKAICTVQSVSRACKLAPLSVHWYLSVSFRPWSQYDPSTWRRPWMRALLEWPVMHSLASILYWGVDSSKLIFDSAFVGMRLIQLVVSNLVASLIGSSLSLVGWPASQVSLTDVEMSLYASATDVRAYSWDFQIPTLKMNDKYSKKLWYQTAHSGIISLDSLIDLTFLGTLVVGDEGWGSLRFAVVSLTMQGLASNTSLKYGEESRNYKIKCSTCFKKMDSNWSSIQHMWA